jgi:hypothetical protein
MKRLSDEGNPGNPIWAVPSTGPRGETPAPCPEDSQTGTDVCTLLRLTGRIAARDEGGSTRKGQGPQPD